MKLTIKQQNFCNLYIETGNASEAYRRAYSADRMLDSTIHRKAVELLENAKVSAYIKQLQAELQRRSDISKDEAVRELTNIVRARITDILTIKGDKVELKDLDSLPDHIVCAIQSIKRTGDTIEVKLYDKIAAIDRLSRMLGWDKPTKVDVQGSIPVKEWIKQFNHKE